MLLAQGAQRRCRGCVASHDDQTAASLNQMRADCQDPAADELVGLRSIRHMGAVRQIGEIRRRQRLRDGRKHRETTESGIKNPDHCGEARKTLSNEQIDTRLPIGARLLVDGHARRKNEIGELAI